MREKMCMVTMHMPKVILDEIEKLIEVGEFPSRSDFIRYAVVSTLRIWKLSNANEIVREIVWLKGKVQELDDRLRKVEKSGR